MLVRKHGNIHVFDMRSRINVNNLRLDFIRYGHMSPSANCQYIAPGKLMLKSSDYKPFSSSHAEDTMMRSVMYFLEKTEKKDINFQSSRIVCQPLTPFPQVKVSNLMGIFCTSRENVQGGVITINDFQRELVPGEMIINNEPVECNISKIHTDSEGHMDVILFRQTPQILQL